MTTPPAASSTNSPAGAGSGGAYASTTALAELARWLSEKHAVVVLTHVKPDGDAVGSTLALARAVNLRAERDGLAPPGEAAQVFYAGPRPGWTPTLVGPTSVKFLADDGRDASRSDGQEPDAIVVCDTGSWTQLESVRPFLTARRDRAAIIDHHVQGNPDVAPRRYIDTGASAAAQPVAELCRLLLGAPRMSALPREVAEPLYFALASDTGWFRHSNTTPAVLRLAADLQEAGAVHSSLYELSEQREKLGRFKLLARALATLTLEHDGTVAVMTLTRQDFADAGAEPGESGGFVDVAGTIAGVRVVALLTEIEDYVPAPAGASGGANGGRQIVTKISLRSKAGEHVVDVNQVARTFGGGGHVQAAGARLVMPLAQARRAVLEALAIRLGPR